MKEQVHISSRNQYLDIVKAFAILCVIIGHCIQFGSGAEYLENQAFFENYLFRFIYSFHMPLFMLISGYFFSLSMDKYSWQENAKKKLKAIVIPIFAWSFLLFSFSCIIGFYQSKKVLSLGEFLWHYLNNSMHNYWFYGQSSMQLLLSL